MKNKIKIVSWVCLVLSCIAVILEAMPKSVRNGSMIDSGEVAYYYHSFFVGFFDFIRFFASATACFTVIIIALVILGLFKKGLAVNILALIVSTLGLVSATTLVCFSKTAFTVIVLLLLLVNFGLQIFKFVIEKRVIAKSE